MQTYLQFALHYIELKLSISRSEIKVWTSTLPPPPIKIVLYKLDPQPLTSLALAKNLQEIWWRDSSQMYESKIWNDGIVKDQLIFIITEKLSM